MLRAVKVRLYPNLKQQEILRKHFGCSRFVYNAALNYKIFMYDNYKLNKSKIDIINELPNLKQEFTFLKEVKAETLQNSIINLDYAYTNFFKQGFGFPKFKNKKSKQSFTQTQSFIVNETHLTFYSNKLKYKCSERDIKLILSSKIKKITYSKNKRGQYFASILIETQDVPKLQKLTKEIGVDLGVKNFLVTSDKTFIENPKHLIKSLNKLKLEQQKLSLKQSKSKNHEKQRLKVAKVYNKITNQRDYFLHNLSSKLINENQVIYIEDLNITGLLKNKDLAKYIQDCSWSKFINMLVYKSQWYGREVKKINRFYPSSKTCSNCGNIKHELTLSDRVYKCEKCNLELDRDYNASLNILSIGMNQPEDIKNASHKKEETITIKI